MLEGESVKTNRHLARFAAARYLPALLANPALDGMLRIKGRSLRKELIEAYVVVEALEQRVLVDRQNGQQLVIIDLCCGKGFLSIVVAYEFPACVVLSVDNNPGIQPCSLPNTRFVLLDVLEVRATSISGTPPLARSRFNSWMIRC